MAHLIWEKSLVEKVCFVITAINFYIFSSGAAIITVIGLIIYFAIVTLNSLYLHSSFELQITRDISAKYNKLVSILTVCQSAQWP